MLMAEKRRVKALKHTIACMLEDGSINKAAHDNMVKVLEKPVKDLNSYLDTTSSPGTCEQSDIYALRTVVTSETPLHCPEAGGDTVPLPPSSFALVEDPACEPAGAFETELSTDQGSGSPRDDDPPADEEQTIVEDHPLVELATNKWSSRRPYGPLYRYPPAPYVPKYRTRIELAYAGSLEDVTTENNKATILNDDWDEVDNPDATKCASEAIPVTENEMKVTTLDNCLFTVCIMCSSMVMIEFGSELDNKIPSGMLNWLGKQYQNALVMTTCRMCNIEDISRFDDVKMNPALMEGSNVMKAAETIVGKYVPLMAHEDRMVYLNMKAITGKLSPKDMVKSVYLPKLSCQERPAMLLPHLLGGYI